MKKFLTVVMALVLCLSMSMSVCAATNSPGSDFVVESEDKNDDTPWENGWLVVERLRSKSDIKSGTSALSKFVGNPDDYELLIALDVYPVGSYVPKFPLKIKFKVPGVNPDTKVVVLHKCAEHGWEELSDICGDGTVKVTFHSFSPVLVFAKKGTTGAWTGAATGTTATGTSSVPTSPKTADPGILMAGAVAAASVVGLAATKRRK